MEVYGASNFTVKTIKYENLNFTKWHWKFVKPVLNFSRLGGGDSPFEAVVTIPKLKIKAKYTSSGVLIIIPASGGGEFNAIFGKFKFIRVKIKK